MYYSEILLKYKQIYVLDHILFCKMILIVYFKTTAYILLKLMLLQAFSLFCLLINIANTIQVVPTWITSSYVQADSAKLINGIKTGNSTTPTMTMTFVTAFGTIPNLGYGIIRYEANDYMASEML